MRALFTAAKAAWSTLALPELRVIETAIKRPWVETVRCSRTVPSPPPRGGRFCRSTREMIAAPQRFLRLAVRLESPVVAASAPPSPLACWRLLPAACSRILSVEGAGDGAGAAAAGGGGGGGGDTCRAGAVSAAGAAASTGELTAAGACGAEGAAGAAACTGCCGGSAGTLAGAGVWISGGRFQSETCCASASEAAASVTCPLPLLPKPAAPVPPSRIVRIGTACSTAAAARQAGNKARRVMNRCLSG